jgi:predicted DNA-binding transcriptional regulator YafY
MKAERLLAALLLLQAHGKLTGRALAERLAVSGAPCIAIWRH